MALTAATRITFRLYRGPMAERILIYRNAARRAAWLDPRDPALSPDSKEQSCSVGPF
jgi:hypothetical protein